MTVLQDIKPNFTSIRLNVMAGITTVLALIPDSLAFAFIAGVNPMISIYSTISILILISIFGGRPGMVSATAGSMAVLMTALVAENGIEYLFAATILTGIIQLLMGVFRLGKLMRFVPHSVITAFVNSLAILIFLAQLHYFEDQSWGMYAMIAGTLLVIYLIPKFTSVVPSPLVAIVIMTLVYTLFPGGNLQTVSDLANLSTSLPLPHVPNIPFTLDTLWVILPTSLSLAIVGYAETLLTQSKIDEMTDTKTSKDKEIRGQGIANTATGFIGGMAGCALVAESYLNVKNGGTTRLSTIVSGVVFLLFIFVFSDLVSMIPIAALVGVMFYVCSEIFDWDYLRNIRNTPISEVVIMVTTVLVVLATHNLAIGVLIGVLLSVLQYAYKSAKLEVTNDWNGEEKVYHVKGQLFFVTAETLKEQIDLTDNSKMVCIDLSLAHVWDHSAHMALDNISSSLVGKGKKVRFHGW
ncbi:SulP family inorganic anion transporter [Bacillus gobiensis]|uniref:SulP family inorganic anion transporter n=1 Tax=Bacillus gobiensis TaxID=1441095 RepID=UPI003D19ABAD